MPGPLYPRKRTRRPGGTYLEGEPVKSTSMDKLFDLWAKRRRVPGGPRPSRYKTRAQGEQPPTKSGPRRVGPKTDQVGFGPGTSFGMPQAMRQAWDRLRKMSGRRRQGGK